MKEVTITATVQITKIVKDVPNAADFSKDSAKNMLISDLKGELGYDDILLRDVKVFELEQKEEKAPKKKLFGAKKPGRRTKKDE